MSDLDRFVVNGTEYEIDTIILNGIVYELAGGGTKYTVTYNLATNILSSNTVNRVAEGSAYTTIISSSSADYQIDDITVTMGGTNITSTAVDGNVISIASVTGNVSITVTAVYYPAVETETNTLTISSGSTGTLKVKLHAEPTQSQTVSLYSDTLTLSSASLTFTTSNWDTYQSVTVTAPSVEDTTYAYINLTNSDPLMTETTIMVTVKELGYEDLVDTTIPAGRHTVTLDEFESNSTYGNYIRVYKYIGQDTNIFVPSEFNGKTVWVVASTTFTNNTSIEYVTFDDGVIYRNAGETSGCKAENLFAGCTNLIGVSNMNTDTANLSSAFSGCTSLEFVDNLGDLVNLTSNYRAFLNCTSLEYIQDLSQWTSVGLSRTFEGCSSLKKVFGMPIPSTAKTFEYCFMGTQIPKAVFPANTSSLKYAFYNNRTVNYIEILADGLATSDLTSMINTSQSISVYANANSTTLASLQSMYASSSTVTVYDRSGTTLPNIVVWGDSTSSANRTWIEWPKRLQTKIGTSEYLIKNEAQSGEYTNSTSARQGGNTLTVNAFTIPADTSTVDITLTSADGYTFSNSPIFSGGQSFNPCVINGIRGTITHANGSQYNQFARLEAGTATSVNNGTIVTSEADTRLNKAGDIMIINIGHNAGWSDTPSVLVNQMQMMVNHFLALGGTDYIVSGAWSGWWISEDSGWAITQQVASLAETAFGNHWLDLPADIASHCEADNPTWEPTAEDLQYISEGKTPVGSLTYDNVHPTEIGANSQMMAFYRKGVALGYWT